MLFRTPPVPPYSVATSEHRHVINEELFHDALVRERKRADRFEEAFALVMITVDRRRLSAATVVRLAESISQSQPRADVIGWFEQDSVLGLIRALPARDAGDSATVLANAFRREVARYLSADHASCCSVACTRTLILSCVRSSLTDASSALPLLGARP